MQVFGVLLRFDSCVFLEIIIWVLGMLSIVLGCSFFHADRLWFDSVRRFDIPLVQLFKSCVFVSLDIPP